MMTQSQHIRSTSWSRRYLRILAAVFLIQCTSVSAETNITDYGYCTVCHGTNANGNPVLQAPKISGLEPWYIENQLKAFAAGFRGTHQQDAQGQEMRAILRMLDSVESISAATDYINSLESVPAPATMTGDVQRGRILYSSCAVCHGEQAQGNRTLQAPGLAIQSDWYLAKQLRDYRSGARGSHKDDVIGAQMRPMALMLADDSAINDVVAYIKSLAAND